MDGLTNGRVVHVNDAGGKCQPGMVTEVHVQATGLINVGGFRALGTPANWTSIKYDEAQAESFGWHWPERA